jgi:hypothetical protein
MTVTFATEKLALFALLPPPLVHHSSFLLLILSLSTFSDPLQPTFQRARTRTMSSSSSWKSKYDDNEEDEENENILTDAQEVRLFFPTRPTTLLKWRSVTRFIYI